MTAGKFDGDHRGVNIVVFDADLWNPDGLPWTDLEAMGKVRPVGTVAKEQIGRVASDADAALVWRTVLNREAIRAMPRLRYIGLLDPDGSARVNVDAAAKRGITVCRVMLPLADSVAEYVFAVLLELSRSVGSHMAAVHRLEWTRSARPCWWRFPLRRLAGRTLGLLGESPAQPLIARRARAFEMRVLGTAVGSADVASSDAVEPSDLDRLLRESDVVVVLAGPEEARGLMGRERLAAMKPSSWLIQVGGPGVVDELALAEVLRQGPAPAMAALDRLSLEPPPPDHPLLSLRNCRITPHQSWATVETRAAFISAAARNLQAWLDGRPEGVLTAGHPPASSAQNAVADP